MTTPFEQDIDKLMAQLATQQTTIEQSMQAAAAVSATATSPDRAVTVTLNQFGNLTELTFGGARYRSMAAAELSRVIIETFSRARSELMDGLAGVYQPTAPGSINVRDLLTGRFDVGQTMRDLITERSAAHQDILRTITEADHG